MKIWNLAGACALALVGAFAAAPHASAQDDPAFGLWMVESGRAIVEIKACGDKACGSIVWLDEPNDETGQPKKDLNNPDASLQGRALCGLAMIGDFVKEEPGEWEDGFIYDASEGDMYDANMESQDDGTLKVRGYVGVSLFGKSQIWTRVDDNRGGC